jgi:formylglycine-generating enzyme required for sulfatase activity
MVVVTLLLTGLILAPIAAGPSSASPEGMVLIPAGTFRPFYRDTAGAKPGGIPVRAFFLDATPVTEGEFRTFVRDHPQWRKSKVKPLFAESNYLQDWRDDLDPGPQDTENPVVFVSWFSARAYCQSRDKRLPTLAEWEQASGFDAGVVPGNAGKPATDNASQDLRHAMGGREDGMVGPGPAFGQIWEWTLDFNFPSAAGLSGGDGDPVASLFCGAGARAVDARNYGAFLRYSFRSSLKAEFALKNLGFRCARDAP